MSAAQQKVIADLKALNFTVIAVEGANVRMSRGSDRRVIMADGSQKRGNHQGKNTRIIQ